LRPCSGAIIVLVFALAQGLFWIGVASTFVMGLGTAITVATVATIAVGARGFAGRLAKGKPGAGMLFLPGVETAAAVLIIVFGVALLTGYMVSERMWGFRRPSEGSHVELRAAALFDPQWILDNRPKSEPEP